MTIYVQKKSKTKSETSNSSEKEKSIENKRLDNVVPSSNEGQTDEKKERMWTSPIKWGLDDQLNSLKWGRLGHVPKDL